MLTHLTYALRIHGKCINSMKMQKKCVSTNIIFGWNKILSQNKFIIIIIRFLHICLLYMIEHVIARKMAFSKLKWQPTIITLTIIIIILLRWEKYAKMTFISIFCLGSTFKLKSIEHKIKHSFVPDEMSMYSHTRSWSVTFIFSLSLLPSYIFQLYS